MWCTCPDGNVELGSGATLQERKVNWPVFSPSGPPLKLWAMGVGRPHTGIEPGSGLHTAEAHNCACQPKTGC